MKKWLLIMILLLACNPKPITDRTGLFDKLNGQYESPAWDGILEETWTLTQDGWPQQQVYYIEKSDTSYRAIGTIESVGGQLVLFTVIEDGDPFIFRATGVYADSIIFENSRNRNPNRVKYEFAENTYKRTISGIEPDGQKSMTVFNFVRKK